MKYKKDEASRKKFLLDYFIFKELCVKEYDIIDIDEIIKLFGAWLVSC